MFKVGAAIPKPNVVNPYMRFCYDQNDKLFSSFDWIKTRPLHSIELQSLKLNWIGYASYIYIFD